MKLSHVNGQLTVVTQQQGDKSAVVLLPLWPLLFIIGRVRPRQHQKVRQGFIDQLLGLWGTKIRIEWRLRATENLRKSMTPQPSGRSCSFVDYLWTTNIMSAKMYGNLLA